MPTTPPASTKAKSRHSDTINRFWCDGGVSFISLRRSSGGARVAVGQLEAVGATVLASTRTTLPGVDLVFVTDPDGTRVELMALGGTLEH